MTLTISTPFPRLNQRLSGGIPCNAMTHVYGPPGTGKTTFGMQLSAEVMKQRLGVLWIDCNNSFALKRLYELICEDNLKYFSLLRIQNWRQFQDVFENVAAFVHATTRLVILDNFAYFYSLSTKKQKRAVQEILFDRYLPQFTKLFRKEHKQFAVVIINQIRADFTDEGTRPVAQMEFELACRVHLLFETDETSEGTQQRRISLVTPSETKVEPMRVLDTTEGVLTGDGFKVM